MSIKYEIITNKVNSYYYLEVIEIDSKMTTPIKKNIVKARYCNINYIGFLINRSSSTVYRYLKNNNGWVSDNKLYFKTKNKALKFAEEFIIPSTILRTLSECSVRDSIIEKNFNTKEK